MQIAWPYPIGKYRNRCVQIYIFSLPEYHTCDVWLSNSMAWPTKLKCVFNKVFLVLVNHWCDILVVTNGYFLVTLIGAQAEKHGFCFPLIHLPVFQECHHQNTYAYAYAYA